MTKEWKKTELARILRDHPELKKVPVMPVDQIVVEFLKLHDVAARPPKNTSRRDGAIAGAITGAFGADVGGDAFLIQGQKTQTQQQEWTSWKQWALSHKDYPEFKNKLTGEATTKNKIIDEKLCEPEFVKKWESFFKESAVKEAERKTKANILRGRAMLVIGLIIGAVVAIANNPDVKEFMRNQKNLEQQEEANTMEKYFKNK